MTLKTPWPGFAKRGSLFPRVGHETLLCNITLKRNIAQELKAFHSQIPLNHKMQVSSRVLTVCEGTEEPVIQSPHQPACRDGKGWTNAIEKCIRAQHLPQSPSCTYNRHALSLDCWLNNKAFKVNGCHWMKARERFMGKTFALLAFTTTLNMEREKRKKRTAQRILCLWRC